MLSPPVWAQALFRPGLCDGPGLPLETGASGLSVVPLDALFVLPEGETRWKAESLALLNDVRYHSKAKSYPGNFDERRSSGSGEGDK